MKYKISDKIKCSLRVSILTAVCMYHEPKVLLHLRKAELTLADITSLHFYLKHLTHAFMLYRNDAKLNQIIDHGICYFGASINN